MSVVATYLSCKNALQGVVGPFQNPAHMRLALQVAAYVDEEGDHYEVRPATSHLLPNSSLPASPEFIAINLELFHSPPAA